MHQQHQDKETDKFQRDLFPELFLELLTLSKYIYMCNMINSEDNFRKVENKGN